MAVDLLTGEKVLYTKDYVKGRSRTVGTVVVTDKRVISTVESKKSTERTEMKLDEVGGVVTRFRPSSVVPLILGFVLLVLFFVFPYIRSSIIGNITFSGGTNIEFINTLFTAVQYIIFACSLISIIIAMFKIRNGLNVVIFTRNREFKLVSTTSISGRIRPIRLRPDKQMAHELARGISAAIKSAKAV